MSTEQTIAPDLAAWESHTMQNIGPHLTPAESEAFWSAILANRAAPDAERFASAARKVVSPNSLASVALTVAMSRFPVALPAPTSARSVAAESA